MPAQVARGEGLQFAHEAVADAERMRLIVDRAGLLVRLGQVSLITGRIEDALKLGKQAVEIAVAHEAKGDEAWARFLIARTCWASNPQDLRRMPRSNSISPSVLQSRVKPVRWLRFARRRFGGIYARAWRSDIGRNSNAAADANYKELGMMPLPSIRCGEAAWSCQESESSPGSLMPSRNSILSPSVLPGRAVPDKAPPALAGHRGP